MFKIRDIVEATGGKLIQGDLGSRIKGISIDSRKISSSELFIAIKGANFDGHDFVGEAIRRSSRGVVISRTKLDRYPENYNVIYVKDTLRALGDIAKFHRSRFSIPVVAITGSCGKTTTKEMVATVLKSKYNVLSNKGTQNNQVGLPLAVLKLRPRHQLAVLELGTNHFGEIEYLSNIAQPTVGILTNIAEAHLEFFKNVSSVFREKFDLVRYLSLHGDWVIYNNDDKFLRKIESKKGGLRTYTFGMVNKSDFYADSVGLDRNRISFVLNGRFLVKMHTPAVHNIYNALAAVACARVFNVNFQQITAALRQFRFPSMRMNIEKINKVCIIDDSYNSNPLSLTNALKTLSFYDCRARKILVCADMMELGRESERIHFAMGKAISRHNIDILITIGRLARNFADGARSRGACRMQIFDFLSKDRAINKLLNIVGPYDIILVKGSRLMRLETLVGSLKEFLKQKQL
jgi:UDP-N-acetylmuramoyl-tripeptide--D-alanyl-D-alanine ligase